MRFKVLKSSLDGISGGASDYNDIKSVLREICHHKGWPSLKALHDSIKKWAKKARPGDVYTTQVTAIVVVAEDTFEYQDDICPYCGAEGLDYQDFDPVEGGQIEQKVSCRHCDKCWLDVFSLTEQRELLRW